MGTLKCVQCERIVPAEDVNIQSDVAKCTGCGAVFKASSGLSAGEQSSFDIGTPPSGVRFQETGTGFVITATTRTPMAFFFVPFTAVWAGGALGGIYVEPLLSGKGLDGNAIFGIPFLIASIVLISISALSVFGTVRVSADGYNGRAFFGIGPIGWSKRFSWRDIDTVSEGDAAFAVNRKRQTQIFLEGKERISFGAMLSNERRYYVAKALEALVNKLNR